MTEIKGKYVDSIDTLIEDTGSLVYEDAAADLALFIEDIDPIMDVVEWDGILYSLNYAHTLHTLIVRLANIRLQKCKLAAQKATVAKIDHINSETSQCFPVDVTVDPAPIIKFFDSLAMNCTLPPLDTYDLMEVIKAYIPGASMLGAAVAGMKFMTHSFTYGKLGRLSLSFLAVGGTFI
jgi:hypothetical protein